MVFFLFLVVVISTLNGLIIFFFLPTIVNDKKIYIKSLKWRQEEYKNRIIEERYFSF